MWRRYRVTEDQLMELLDRQKDVCAACGMPFDTGPGSANKFVPALDHDHSCCPAQTSCGKYVRGIVHFRCNLLMGIVGDNPEVLRNIAGYLERHALVSADKVLEVSSGSGDKSQA
jgi:hypothetical protein